jgi:hypothetical protein
MKKNLAIVILDKLHEFWSNFIIILLIKLLLGLAAGMPVPRMYYTNFDRAITEKYQVILEGWPLEKFCSPSEIASRNEVSVLMTSFESGATRFRKLSPTEFEKWSDRSRSNVTDLPTAGLTGLNTTLPSSNTTDESTAAAVTGPNTTLPTSDSSSLPSDSTPTHESPVSPPLPDPISTNDLTPNRPNHDPPVSPTSSSLPSPDVENMSPSEVPAKRMRSHAEPSTSRYPLTNAFINSGVTSANGATIMVNGKARKPRADKGKKRGPRVK